MMPMYITSMWRKRTFAELAAETEQRKGMLPLVLLLHNVRSQYNVGALMRTADAVGIEKVVLSGYTPRPEQSGVKKTALKGLSGVKWEEIEDVGGFIVNYKKKGYSIYALEQCHESVSYNKIAYQYPAVLILGEEIAGIDDQLLNLSDIVVEIPMHGQAHSLNVSVAGGIMLYEFLSQFGS